MRDGWDLENIDIKLALVELDEDIEFSEKVQPVCLASQVLRSGNDAMLTGWRRSSRYLPHGRALDGVMSQMYVNPVITARFGYPYIDALPFHTWLEQLEGYVSDQLKNTGIVIALLMDVSVLDRHSSGEGTRRTLVPVRGAQRGY